MVFVLLSDYTLIPVLVKQLADVPCDGLEELDYTPCGRQDVFRISFFVLIERGELDAFIRLFDRALDFACGDVSVSGRLDVAFNLYADKSLVVVEDDNDVVFL